MLNVSLSSLAGSRIELEVLPLTTSMTLTADRDGHCILSYLSYVPTMSVQTDSKNQEKIWIVTLYSRRTVNY